MFDILVTVPVCLLVIGSFFGLLRARRAFTLALVWSLVWIGAALYQLVDAIVWTNNFDDQSIFTNKIILTVAYVLIASLGPLIGVMASWFTSRPLPLEATPAHKASKAAIFIGREAWRRYRALPQQQQCEVQGIARGVLASAFRRLGDHLNRRGSRSVGAFSADISELCEGIHKKK